MGSSLKDKVAIVTGSGTGIGKAIALAMAEEGAKLVLNNRSPQGPESSALVAKQITDAGGKAIAVFGDVSSFKFGEELVKAAVDTYGRVDILVNNAGIDVPRMVWNMSEDEWDKCVDVLLKGTFNCTRFAAGRMREQKWGRIINMTSTAWLGAVGHANYSAAKAGIVGFTYGVAREVGRYAVTCNCITPTAGTRMTLTDEVRAGMKRRLDAGLITQEYYEEMTNPPAPDTVPPLILYLCSDAGIKVNGQLFRVHGGRLSLYSVPQEVKSIYRKDGLWSIEELEELMPKTLLVDYTNPAPPEAVK